MCSKIYKKYQNKEVLFYVPVLSSFLHNKFGCFLLQADHQVGHHYLCVVLVFNTQVSPEHCGHLQTIQWRHHTNIQGLNILKKIWSFITVDLVPSIEKLNNKRLVQQEVWLGAQRMVEQDMVAQATLQTRCTARCKMIKLVLYYDKPVDRDWRAKVTASSSARFCSLMWHFLSSEIRTWNIVVSRAMWRLSSHPFVYRHPATVYTPHTAYMFITTSHLYTHIYERKSFTPTATHCKYTNLFKTYLERYSDCLWILVLHQTVATAGYYWTQETQLRPPDVGLYSNIGGKGEEAFIEDWPTLCMLDHEKSLFLAVVRKDNYWELPIKTLICKY